MSVLVEDRVERRSWRGYDDPGLPVGMWVGEVEATGDASAGFVQLSLLFQIAADPLSAFLFNLEQIMISHDNEGGGTDIATLSAVRLGFLTDSRPFAASQRWNFQLDNSGPRDVPAFANALTRPLFLGRPTTRGNTATLEAQLLNVNLVGYTMQAQGYVWEPRSILAPGGLRRPTDSLFG